MWLLVATLQPSSRLCATYSIAHATNTVMSRTLLVRKAAHHSELGSEPYLCNLTMNACVMQLGMTPWQQDVVN